MLRLLKRPFCHHSYGPWSDWETLRYRQLRPNTAGLGTLGMVQKRCQKCSSCGKVKSERRQIKAW